MSILPTRRSDTWGWETPGQWAPAWILVLATIGFGVYAGPLVEAAFGAAQVFGPDIMPTTQTIEGLQIIEEPQIIEELQIIEGLEGRE